MSRKKEGSIITGRLSKSPRKGEVVGRENSIIKADKGQSSRADDFVKQLLGFIQHYEVAKQNFTYNLATEHIFTQSVQSNIDNDEDICFDVDLGVPYVQSHHLDSGFQYDEKSNPTTAFPKVSSAKEIFTSVLQIDSQQNIQSLDEENFTDQQEDEEGPSFASVKSATFKKRSRKLQPQMEFQQLVPENSPRESQWMSKHISNNSEQIQMSIVEKLKSTVLSRGQKIEYWNQRLGELDSFIAYDQEFDDLPKSQMFNHQKIQVERSRGELNLVKKRSKFQRNPINKKAHPLIIQVNLNTNKQNIIQSPKSKIQTKSMSFNQQKSHHRHLSNEKNSFQKSTLLNKNVKTTNLSKQRSLVKKVY